MGDELAKAMYAATHRLPSWEMMVDSAQKGYLSGMVQDEVEGIREMARAACDFLGITPEQAERMEKGAVGKAVEICYRWYRNSNWWHEERRKQCREILDEILRALGVEVDGG